MSFGCERSCSSPRRVSNFNSKVPQGGIYPNIKFERDRLNIFRVRVFTSSGSTGGGGDAKTIISPNPPPSLFCFSRKFFIIWKELSARPLSVNILYFMCCIQIGSN